jgi:predicted AAA+ superfamily ATPase
MDILHAVNDLQILPRLLATGLRRALRASPVVVVTGARQTGKSTLVRGLSDHAYVTLDDLDVLDRARRDPESVVRSARGPLVLDEVQRAPDLLLAVKRAVDERRTPGRFVLTGSADLLLLERVAESLAGRAVHLVLHPMTRRERLGRARAGLWPELLKARDEGWPALLATDDAGRADWRAEATKGGYPVPSIHARDADERADWFAGYERTYLERDLREIASVASLVDFRRLIRAACLRLGSLVNQTELGRDVGLSQATVHRHLDLLEASYQLVRVGAYSVNRTKRLVKTPKLYWNDSGLALHLSGEDEPRGAHLENLILSDLIAWRDSGAVRPDVLFWRAASGSEVDFVIESQGKLLPVEVEATERPRSGDADGLLAFREEYGRASRAGLLLHGGAEVFWISKGVLAAPWWKVA